MHYVRGIGSRCLGPGWLCSYGRTLLSRSSLLFLIPSWYDLEADWHAAQIIGATAQKTTTVAAASTIVGFGAGVAFVAYPGISELLPNKYRYVPFS